MPSQLSGATALFQVYDMPRSIRFYRDLLGFEVISTSPSVGEDRFGWAWLRSGKAEIMLNTAYELDKQRPAAPDAARVTGHGDVCLYIGCPDVDGAFEELRSKGLKLRPPSIAPYGMKQLYLTDPDGFNVCFQWAVNG
jgi:catechol 2,3-dioxygenase-like lactoylglutathione lyase family enzyme